LTKVFKDFYTKENLEKLGLNDRQIKGILYVKEKGSINNSLYQKLNEVGKTTATEELQELVQKGVLLQTGIKGRGIRYTISNSFHSSSVVKRQASGQTPFFTKQVQVI